MRVFTLALQIILLPAKYLVVQNPLLKLKYDKVVIYSFKGGIGSDMSIIDRKGHIARSMIKHAILSKEDVLILSE